jgi:hypothetical protein
MNPAQKGFAVLCVVVPAMRSLERHEQGSPADVEVISALIPAGLGLACLALMMWLGKRVLP